MTHFAGDVVVYCTKGWLKKNTDTLHEDLQVCMSSSTSPILSKLFSVGTINAITGGARGGGKRAGYVAEKYARQLEDLMRTLRASHSHFVRCVKPNHQQEPNRFINDLVLSQLRNSGMVDAVRLRSLAPPPSATKHSVHNSLACAHHLCCARATPGAIVECGVQHTSTLRDPRNAV